MVVMEHKTGRIQFEAAPAHLLDAEMSKLWGDIAELLRLDLRIALVGGRYDMAERTAVRAKAVDRAGRHRDGVPDLQARGPIAERRWACCPEDAHSSGARDGQCICLGQPP